MKVFVKALEQKGPKKYIRDAKQMEIDREIAKVVKGRGRIPVFMKCADDFTGIYATMF